MSRSPGPRSVQNRLLAGLPRPDQQRLLAATVPVELSYKEVLCEPGEPLRHVYFPTSGVVSVLANLPDDSGIEAGTIGAEGLVGLRLSWGVRSLPFRVMVQVAGAALRMDASRFQAEVDRPGAVHDIVGRFNAALFVQLGQSAACNGLHTVRQRCARWLLMTHDRMRAEEFPLTQELFAQMLGVRRASIVEAARQLQRAGLIEYHRGAVTIRNRERLEAAACPCYHIVRDAYDRLMSFRA
jgi:CRP-like cAMP-binding protein